MLPYTFPSVLDGATRRCVVFPLSSITNLTAWIDYIPAKKVTGSVKNSYNNNGSQAVSELGSTTGKQAWLDYIPVYYSAGYSKAWSTDASGYIPVSTD